MMGEEREPLGMIAVAEDVVAPSIQTDPPQSSWVLLCGEACQDGVSVGESRAVSFLAMSWGQCVV